MFNEPLFKSSLRILDNKKSHYILLREKSLHISSKSSNQPNQTKGDLELFYNVPQPKIAYQVNLPLVPQII